MPGSLLSGRIASVACKDAEDQSCMRSPHDGTGRLQECKGRFPASKALQGRTACASSIAAGPYVLHYHFTTAKEGSRNAQVQGRCKGALLVQPA